MAVIGEKRSEVVEADSCLFVWCDNGITRQNLYTEGDSGTSCDRQYVFGESVAINRDGEGSARRHVSCQLGHAISNTELCELMRSTRINRIYS